MATARRDLTPAGFRNEIATGERQAAAALLASRHKVGAHFASEFEATAKRLRQLARAAADSTNSLPSAALKSFVVMTERIGGICPPKSTLS